MSTDEYDVIYDCAMNDLYNQNIDEYKYERFREYFIENKTCHHNALNIRQESIKLHKLKFYGASIIYSFSCIETTIRDLFFIPLFNGIIIDYTIGEFVTNKFLERSNKIDNLSKYLFKFIGDKIGVNLSSDKIIKHKDTVWKEISDIKNIRNLHVHKGYKVYAKDSDKAIKISKYLLEKIFFRMLNSSSLEINSENIITDKQYKNN